MTDSPAPARAPWWRTLVRVITVIEMTIAIVCLVMIALLVFFQALQRYLPIDQIAWTGEVSQFCLVWLTFAVAGVLITTRGHITLEILDGLRSRVMVRIVQTVAMLISAFVAALLVVEAIELIDTQGIIKSPVLRISMSLVYIPILIGVASTAIRSLIQAIQIAITGPILPDVEDDAEVVA